MLTWKFLWVRIHNDNIANSQKFYFSVGVNIGSGAVF